jgi:3-mercaptopyruvate sulfurtransferase SseA
VSHATIPTNAVTDVAPAGSREAIAHFQRLLTLETDCHDVHQALGRKDPGFVLLDVRSPEAYAKGHLPGAINLPHRRMTGRRSQAIHPTRCLWCTAPGRTATAPTAAHSGSPSSAGR